MSRRSLPAFLFAALAGTGAAPAFADGSDPACKPVIDADKARAAAPAWHAKKTMGGMSMEIIRLGNDVYADMGGTGWKQMPPPMAANIVNAGNQADQFTVSDCRKLGDETINGVATTLWSFKTKVKDLAPITGKVWIGQRDGLPYREEGEKHAGTTTYQGVAAPKLK
ncbi:MAG: hypothetical protein K0Q76_2245 [Panacagrimonas sp.]|jgi:hypothetical protein|nr:hypothetical protein [Panacagrimonas sp.]MCC2657137.1 hypothetical protein [Panacagrimonas sp.]